jgi:UDP-glucose 4-epimerase
MVILVTGSSGRVGHAIARLLAREHDVRGLDLVPGPFTTDRGSILDPRRMRLAAVGADAIVHVASLHVPQLKTHSEGAFAATNVEGTRILLEAALAMRVQRIVYASTTSVYGTAMVDSERAVWVTEELRPQPRDIYDRTKLEAEALCASASASGRLSCIVLRFSRCFPEAPQDVASYRLYRGVDGRDVAEAHRLALVAQVGSYCLLNISANHPFTPADCYDLKRDARAVILRCLPWAEEAFRRRGWCLPDSIDRVYSIERARKAIGYLPRYNVPELLTETASGDRSSPHEESGSRCA